MKMKKRSLGIFIIALVVIIAIIMVVKTPGNNNMANQVKLETNHGDIIIELYLEEMPITAGNFKKLVEEGFYDGIIFHRIIQDFMLQGGDPTGTGTGGPGYKIQDEFTNTAIDQNNRGTLSMSYA